MGEKSKIQWTHHTFNPWIGCTKISDGCKHCYAAQSTFVRIQRKEGRHLWGPDAERHITSASAWSEPLVWNRRCARAGVRERVFCASLADVFEDRPDLEEPRRWLFALIEATPHLDWLVVTKRPDVAAGWFGGTSGAGLSAPALPNLWMGATVENQKQANARIPWLLTIPARYHFLSVEPMLEEINVSPFLGVDEHGDDDARIDWIICGGESGEHARPFNVEWARRLLEQCRRDGHARFFMKQLGDNCLPFTDLSMAAEPMPGGVAPTKTPSSKKGGDIADFPVDLKHREYPNEELGA